MNNTEKHISVNLTATQAAIVLTALEEYQADWEAAINGLEISGINSINALTDYTVFITETELAIKTIQTQIRLT